jgi:o-succinylbenzoate synthase
MPSVDFIKYTLQFIKPGGTSRGILKTKDTWIIRWMDNSRVAYGECNMFKGLSYDDRPIYEDKLAEVCNRLPNEGEAILDSLGEWPSIKFGVETLMRDIQNGYQHIIFPEAFGPSGFTVPINGLIWMSGIEEMKLQIESKLREGFASIKLKIGAIDFDAEIDLIRYIRKRYQSDEVEIRLDANGAFSFAEAQDKIKRLSEYNISYIEQPIKAGQWQEMAALSDKSPIDIALDEELIGLIDSQQQQSLIDTIRPQLLILKPALIGGFAASDLWKRRIENIGGSWVITSALESNLGLNAIAQYTAKERSAYAQGLGTGKLFSNNFPSPYTVDAQGIHYQPFQLWDFKSLI